MQTQGKLIDESYYYIEVFQLNDHEYMYMSQFYTCTSELFYIHVHTKFTKHIFVK